MTTVKDHLVKRLWKAWLKFGHWLGDIMSWVWMPIFYYFIAMPFALGIKWFSDPLRIRVKRQKSYWISRKTPHLDLAWAKSQGNHSVNLKRV